MKKIKHSKITKGMNIKQFVNELDNSAFQAKNLYKACSVFKKMVADKQCVKFLGLAGALIPGGMRNIIGEMLNKKLIDVLVLTGANITHDLIEAFGQNHYFMVNNKSDETLAKKNINRIYDVLLPNKGYLLLEDNVKEIVKKLPEKEMSSAEFLYYFGKYVKDKKSILRIANKNKIPVFSPSITDSSFGLNIWLYTQEKGVKLNPMLDWKESLDIAFTAKKTGALYLGGGVPKNFINQTMLTSNKLLSYAIQVTTDRPEYGGSSGAKLKEAKSWRKIRLDANIVNLSCDATIALPVLYGYVIS